MLEISDVGSRGIVLLAKTKALISCAVTAQLICIFVFAYAKCRFSHNAAQITPTMMRAGSSSLINFCIHSRLIWLSNFLRSRVILRLSIVNRAPRIPPIIPMMAVGMNISRLTSTPESI